MNQAKNTSQQLDIYIYINKHTLSSHKKRSGKTKREKITGAKTVKEKKKEKQLIFANKEKARWSYILTPSEGNEFLSENVLHNERGMEIGTNERMDRQRKEKRQKGR